MLLQRLKEYADQRMQLPPTLYAEAPVRYIVELDSTGRLLSPQPVDTADTQNKALRRGQRYLVPQIRRESGVKPLLLIGNAEYTLGLPRDEKKAARVAACHAAYVNLLQRCAAETNDPAIDAVCAFLADQPAKQLNLPDDFDRAGTITFRVDGTFPFDLPSVQTFWAGEHDPAARGAAVMQCLVCGEDRPVLDRLQAKIKGIPGGQTSGTALISANAPAFESYGLEASYIAPTCAACGERFTKALNALLSDRQSHFILGKGAFVFWTREPLSEDFFFTALTNPDSTQVRALIDSIRTGRRQPEIDEMAFYAASLSNSGGRTVVRDWLDTTVGAVQRSLATWFERQLIVDRSGELPRPLALTALALSTVREPKDLAAITGRTLLRAALDGTPLPTNLLQQTVRRISAGRQRPNDPLVTRPQASLIKLVLRSHAPPQEEDTLVQLDPLHPNPAYHCGRLLAVLEQAQERAIQNLRNTIVDRFWGTASSAPASVFPRLISGARPHLTKLKRDSPATGAALQRRVEDITGQISAFPRILALQEQGLFALGYYHQRAFDRAQAREAAERHRAEPTDKEGA